MAELVDYRNILWLSLKGNNETTNRGKELKQAIKTEYAKIMLEKCNISVFWRGWFDRCFKFYKAEIELHMISKFFRQISKFFFISISVFNSRIQKDWKKHTFTDV